MNWPSIIVLAVVAALVVAASIYLAKKGPSGCTSDKSHCPTCDNADCPLKKAQKKDI